MWDWANLYGAPYVQSSTWLECHAAITYDSTCSMHRYILFQLFVCFYLEVEVILKMFVRLPLELCHVAAMNQARIQREFRYGFLSDWP